MPVAPNRPTNPIDRLLRLKDVLRIIPISRSGWWRGISEGRYPAGRKLSPRVTVWRESEILALLENPSDLEG